MISPNPSSCRRLHFRYYLSVDSSPPCRHLHLDSPTLNVFYRSAHPIAMVRPLLQNTPGWVMMANNMRQTMGMPIDLMDETEVVFQTRRLCEEAEARQAEALKKIKVGGTTGAVVNRCSGNYWRESCSRGKRSSPLRLQTTPTRGGYADGLSSAHYGMIVSGCLSC